MYKKTIFKNVEVSNHGSCPFASREISETELKKVLKTIEWDTVFVTTEKGEEYRIERVTW